MSFTLKEVKAIIREVAETWNRDHPDFLMWVNGGKPGVQVLIPTGHFFGSPTAIQAGMTLPIKLKGAAVMIYDVMRPESILTTFLHEFGHVQYLCELKEKPNEIQAEKHAIRFSLEFLDSRGWMELAQQEAAAIEKMADREPYKSAVSLLANDANWQKYRSRKEG